jgi:hypothetical protein
MNFNVHIYIFTKISVFSTLASTAGRWLSINRKMLNIIQLSKTGESAIETARAMVAKTGMLVGIHLRPVPAGSDLCFQFRRSDRNREQGNPAACHFGDHPAVSLIDQRRRGDALD